MIHHTAYPSLGNTAVFIRTRAGKEMAIQCTSEQYLAGLEKYKAGAMIQDAFPFLSADEREFLISGMTPTEFDAMFREPVATSFSVAGENFDVPDDTKTDPRG